MIYIREWMINDIPLGILIILIKEIKGLASIKQIIPINIIIIPSVILWFLFNISPFFNFEFISFIFFRRIL